MFYNFEKEEEKKELYEYSLGNLSSLSHNWQNFLIKTTIKEKGRIMSKTSTNIFSGSRMKEVCATCQFWDCGSREITYNGRKQQNILVDGGYFRDCKCSIARTSRVAQLNSSCPKWKKWVNLD